MSLPTPDELKGLRVAKRAGDDEVYHSEFDDALEAKLMALDPEWMTAMAKEYKKSLMARWCA